MQQPLGHSSTSSVKRGSQLQDLVYEGYVEASTTRNIAGLTLSYWRLSRAAVTIYPNGIDPKAKPQFEILVIDFLFYNYFSIKTPFSSTKLLPLKTPVTIRPFSL